MKKLILLTAIIFLGSCNYAYGQTECPHPSGCVTISREAAVKALQDSDTVEAQKKELAAKDQAIEDLKKLLHDVEIQLAKMAGEKSQLEADRVRWTAIIDVLIKNSRAKKNGLINF